MRQPFDVAVLGGGIAGTMAALHTASLGLRTLCVDASALVRPSRGYARVFRILGDGSESAVLADRALTRIAEMERTLGRTLFLRTGTVFIGPSQALASVRRQADSPTADAEFLQHRDLTKLYPHLRLDPQCEGVRDNRGGILLADATLAAVQELAQLRGALILHSRCRGIDRGRHTIGIRTDNGIHHAAKVIVALGAWTTDFLHREGLALPCAVTTVRSLVGMYRLHGACRPNEHPPFVYYRGSETVWGVADVGGAWKLGVSGPHPTRNAGLEHDEAMHAAPEPHAVAAFDRTVSAAVVIEDIAPRWQWCFDGYTDDKTFVTGAHPADGRIHLLTGLSGRGFKMAPALGDAVANALAVDVSAPYR